ncbi:MAG: phospho-N-acetylmuramoyl-pentapeptide-transferase [Acidimicrobiia bacterium]|nr:phospho-N-acetylmuramoyl-pentapeptide-transferase [Acidimicrobiia bacterium]MYC56981.1 phospho-N-acetylmuramoyl-pentapeptide-transferase [Acidimicrobiia bacterium]MYG94087.1 phospho-N-acetylmuramoyl-pentapeptide-transferase [Acidimicrobiia bacterium]MYI30846.1 phospho-N-acetylmuramoyl-pentapeptide-transferase [Acidimicrobiia bacterium]
MIRLLFALAISGIATLVGTRFLILFLRKRSIGQPIRLDGPQGHASKAGTPTMGGVAIVGGALAGYVISDLYNGIFTRTGLIVMFTILAAAAVGFVDDWLKVSRERNLGLNKTAKILGLLTVAITYAVLMLQFTDVRTELSFTRYNSLNFDLGPWGWGLWVVLLILASSNAVNLTDGLDSLAAGASVFVFAAFVVIGFWAFRHEHIYGVPHALDLAIIAAVMAGAIAGFMWWNAAPARIFMGDTGSLALGTGMATMALATNTHLLLPIIAGLFVMETLSVIIQVFSFRVFGKRVFRMAPVHHHFELWGWPETTVIIRLWIVAGLVTAVALGLFYADFVSVGGAE